MQKISSNIRTFVTEIIEKITQSEELSDLPTLKEPQLNERFQIFIKTLNNPILQLYNSYQFKNFIGDMCSDLKFNLKKPANLQESLQLFLNLANFSQDSQTKEISYDFLSATPLLKTLNFLNKCLINNEEFLYYVLNIQDLVLPLLEFCVKLFENLNNSKIKPQLFEFLELGGSLTRFLRTLFCEKKLIALKTLIIKQSFSNFLALLGQKYTNYAEIRSNLIEILEFLVSLDKKSFETVKIGFLEYQNDWISLYRSSANIENIQDIDLTISLIKLTAIFQIFPIDYITYSRMLKQQRVFLSEVLKNQVNKAKFFKILLPKLFILMSQRVKILGSGKKTNKSLEKAFEEEKNVQKLVFLPEIFENLMGFLEELCEYQPKNSEILFIIELFLREVFGLLSLNNWNFAIIKENDYDILNKLVKLIGKSSDLGYNKQILDLILYIFTVFQRNHEEKSFEELNELIKSLRFQENASVRGLILESLQKIFEFFKEDFSENEKEILWNLCDLLIDSVRQKRDFLNKTSQFTKESEGFSRENVESLINLLKVLLRNNRVFLIEVKQNLLFKDLLLSLDEQSLEFISFLLFLLREELAFTPNSLNIYCEMIEKEIIKSFNHGDSLEKFRCLLIFIEKIFSFECTAFKKIFKKVFLEHKNLLNTVLKGFQFIKDPLDFEKYLQFLQEFLHKSDFFKRFLNKNPHLFKENLLAFAKTAKTAEILRKTLAISYFLPENTQNSLQNFEFFPKNRVELVWTELIAWILEENLVPLEKSSIFLEESFEIMRKHAKNAAFFLDSDFFVSCYESLVLQQPQNLVIYLDFLASALKNTQFFTNSRGLAKVFEHLLQPNTAEIRDFFSQVCADCRFLQFQPAFLRFSSKKAEKLVIPRVSFSENGLSLFFWLKVEHFKGNSAAFLLEIAEFLSPITVYFSLFFKEGALWLRFLNYSETKLEKLDLQSEKWQFFGVCLNKSKEVFTINFFLDGILQETRFYILQKPLEMMYRLLRFCLVNCENDDFCSFSLGSVVGFKKNLSQNEALALFLCNNSQGVCQLFRRNSLVNEDFFEQNIAKTLDFADFLETGVPELAISQRKAAKSLEICEKTRFFFNFEELSQDLFLLLSPENRVFLRNEGLLQNFCDDFSDILNKTDQISLIINSCCENSANFLNKAAEWTHALQFSQNSATISLKIPLSQLLLQSGFAEKLLRMCKDAAFFKIFSKMWQSSADFRGFFPADARGFLQETLKNQRFLEVCDIFQLFSRNSRLLCASSLKDFLLNQEIMQVLSLNERKTAIIVLRDTFLEESNVFQEINANLLRNHGIPAVLLDFFVRDVSNSLEEELFSLVFAVIRPYKSLKLDVFLLKQLKNLLILCQLHNFKEKPAQKLEVSAKKLEKVLENGLKIVEKLASFGVSQVFNCEFLLGMLLSQSLNANPGENSQKIAKILVKLLLSSLEKVAVEWFFNNFETFLKVLAPFLAESAIFLRDFAENHDFCDIYHVFLLFLNFKGLETLQVLWNSCVLLGNTADFLAIIQENSEFSERNALIFLNNILKKSPSKNLQELASLQTVLRISAIFKNLYRILEFFKEKLSFSQQKEQKAADFSIFKFEVAEKLVKILAKYLMFNDFLEEEPSFAALRQAHPLIIEVLSSLLLNFLRKHKETEGLLLLDKLILQIQSELSEEVALVIIEKTFAKTLEIPDFTEFFAVFPAFSQFLAKFLKKIMRKAARFDEMLVFLRLSASALRKREEAEAFIKKKPKETLFSLFFSKRSSEKMPVDCEFLQQNLKNLAIVCLSFLVKSSLDAKNLVKFYDFLKESCVFFFEGKFERDDFFQALISLVSEGVASPEPQFSQLCFEFLRFLAVNYRTSAKRVLKVAVSGDFADRFFEIVAFCEVSQLKLAKTREGFRLEGLLKAECAAFLGNIEKTLKEDQANPLIFTSELRFYETTKEKTEKIAVFLAPKPQELCLLAGNLSFFELQRSIFQEISRQVAETLRFERSVAVSAYSVRENAELFTKKQEILDVYDVFCVNSGENRKNLAFCHRKKPGFSLEKRLISLKRAPEFVIKEQISAPIARNSAVPQLVPPFSKNSSRFREKDSTSSSSDAEFEASLEESLEIPRKLSAKPESVRKNSEKSAFLRDFLEEFGVFEAAGVEDCFEIALLKEREAFLEGLLLLGAEKVHILLGFVLNDCGLPAESEGKCEKSRFLQKKKREFSAEMPSKPAFLHSFKRFRGFKRVISLEKREFREIHTRRYWLQPCAIEIFSSFKAFFLVFNVSERDFAYRRIVQAVCGDAEFLKLVSKKHQMLFTVFYRGKPQGISQKTFTSHQLLRLSTPLWKKGLLSNFEYLMLLNQFSGRTYCDLSQYPVFPWILANYSAKYQELDLLQEQNYRDLSKPIGALTEERAKLAQEKYESTAEERSLFPAFHYGSHYSSAVLVLYYLIRLMPYSKHAISLQGGHFDLSDRLFANFHDTWSLANNLDYKELIPEIYYLPEFLININGFDLGKTQTNQLVRDVILPQWCLQDPRFFTKMQRKALESVHVGLKLQQWVDLIFGYKQKGPAAVEALNLFYFLTYEEEFDVDLYSDPLQKSAMLDQINEYGQTPKQLLKKPHALRKCLEKTTLFCYDFKKLQNLRPCVLLEDASQSKIARISTNFQENRSFRRSFLRNTSPGLLSSRTFAEFLANLIEEEQQSYSKSNHLLALKSIVKKLIENQEKSSNSQLLMEHRGFCLISAKETSASSCLQKLLSWRNAYNLLLLLRKTSKTAEKPENIEIIDSFPKEVQHISQAAYYNAPKLVIFGTSFGVIHVFELCKSFEAARVSLHKRSKDEIKEKSNKNATNMNKSKFSLKTFLDFQDLSQIFKPVLPFYQLNEKKIYVVKRGDYSSMRSQTSNILEKEENSQNSKEFLTQTSSFPNESAEKIKHRSLERRFLLRGGHNHEISHLKVLKSYGLLISCDIEGVLAFWNLENGKLVRKICSHHYQNLALCKQIFDKFEENKEKDKEFFIRIKHHRRQKILSVELCEETGDFLLISKNYVSFYSINGVLLAIEQVTEQKFSSGLIFTNRNNSTFEDLYIVTGHLGGTISFWVLKLSGNPPQKDKFHNINTDIYKNQCELARGMQGKAWVPYKLQCIYRVFTSEYSNLFEENQLHLNENLTVETLGLSVDQKKLYSYHKNKKILCW